MFFPGGVVSRLFKQHSNVLYTNDMEKYSYILNKCYLFNKCELNVRELDFYYNKLNFLLNNNPLINNGFIYELYAPKDDKNIKLGERCFYTTRNAKFLDTALTYLQCFPEPYKTLLLGPLLYEASTKNNTSGVFKGFYKNSRTRIGQFGGNGKNALHRIMSDIEIKKPILSNFNCKTKIYQGDALEICKIIPRIDLAYLDPPYNQHPYGSNYFMLNLICDYKKPVNISLVSGIPKNWNKSNFNIKSKALFSLEDICLNIKAKYILISYNSEGFISYDEMLKMLNKIGKVRVFEQNYNVFRASRNLNKRNIHLKEYLFLLKK